VEFYSMGQKNKAEEKKDSKMSSRERNLLKNR
jgi:hypothetical protein